MTYNDIESFVSNFPKRAGSYRIKSLPLDLYLGGVENGLLKNDKVTVCFSGAVTKRSLKEPPFFSGLGVAKELGCPIIAFSDPSLEFSNTLNLAWYAGNMQCFDLPFQISIFLDSISARFGVEFVLFGGSGGGFASLAVSSLMKSGVSVLVWNPQVQIERYNNKFVESYIRLAFPYSRLEKNELSFAEFFDAVGVLHKIDSGCYLPGKKIVYLQNMSDPHIYKQCKFFFINADAFRRVSNRSFFYGDDIFLYVGDWGYGHQPPPKSLIIDLLRMLCLSRASNFDPLSVIYESRGLSHERVAPIHAEAPPPSFKVIVDNEGEGVFLVSVEFLDNNDYDYEFAFYLVVDGVRSATQWYSRSSVFRFEVCSFGVLEVVVFLKDVFGDVFRRKILLEIDGDEVKFS